jgi:nucleoside-diphosphate-sugar epimerase
MSRGLVAVTGATGFVGRRLLPVLAARGWRPRVLARRRADPNISLDNPETCDTETVIGDLADASALATLTDGADAVIHAAGLIKASRRADFFAVNAEGAARLARATGPARMVMISSLAAREPGLSDYAASKRAGEAAAREVLGERLTVLRPPAIYGPGDRETLALFQLAGASPILPLPGPDSARLALAHVDDVVEAIADQLEDGWAPGVFGLGGAKPAGYGWREIFTTAAKVMGRRPALIRIPAWPLNAAAALSERLASARGVPAIFTPGKAREILHPDWSVSAAESPSGAGRPCLDLEAGFAQTVAWYRREGWLR